MQKSIVTIFILLCTGFISLGQKVDYKEARKSEFLSTCGDSISTLKARQMLLYVDADNIGANKDMYYHDLGYVYYKMSLYTRNSKYMDTAVQYQKKALKINPANTDALWDCTIALIFSKPRHCKEGMQYMDRYLKAAPANDVDTATVNELRSICQ